MTKADTNSAVFGQLQQDLLIVGGGIMGLWAAYYAAQAGLKTLLVERGTIGSSTSGGLLGALMPHAPDRWNDKKQFQFDALMSLEGEIRQVEAASGLQAGYRRSGRLVPLAKPHLRAIADEQMGSASTHWTTYFSGHRPGHYSWQTRDTPFAPDWPVASACLHGCTFDTLSARVSPRQLIAVLRAVLEQSPLVTLREHTELETLNPAEGKAVLAGGDAVHFGHAILAAGVRAFPLLDAIQPGLKPSGTAVKGQAALLQANIDPNWPILFDRGLYIVPHENGSVAIGSTSEVEFADPASTDGKLDDLLDEACALSPLLRGAPVIERWAGLRPKAIGRDPMVGQHPEFPRLSLLTGGFKVSFGLAHRLARSVVESMTGASALCLPDAFRVEAHLDKMRG